MSTAAETLKAARIDVPVLGDTKMKPAGTTCLIILLSVTACCRIGDAEPNSNAVVEGNNKFALELYQNLQGREGNLFLSPYSISTALAMTYAGAKDRTEKQMAETLCFPSMGSSQLHKEFGEIIRKLNEAGEKGGYELVVANALWGQKDYSFLGDFLTLVRTNYGGDLQQVDFVKQTEEARKTINTWVESKTKDKIKELQHPYWVCDSSKAIEELGFVPKVGIKEGIKWTADWYRIHQWL